MLRLVAQFQTALQRGERAGIVANARALVEARANLAGQWWPLAMIAAHNGEGRLARASFDLFIASAPDDPAAHFRKVDLLAQLGAWREALAMLRAWPARWARPATYAYARGTAAFYLGEADEARAWLEEAVARQPLAGTPWLTMNLLVDYASEPALAERALAAEATMARAPPVARGTFDYTLGKVHADRGEPARAFAAYARGAALLKREFAYSREADRASAEEAVSGWDAVSIAELSAQQHERTGRCIFVLGLPRSGTTLVEQILTSHSAVVDGGEIYRLPLLARETGGASHAAAARYVGEAGAGEAARLWAHWLQERFPEPGRVVTKTPTNSRFLGVAAALLPQAPLVWVTRNPLDCAWSCFRTRFAGEAPWSYDLEDIAFHFRREDALLARWRAVLGERLLVVPYEALVAEPETWTRRLLAHCGLADEPGPFAPHENARPVTTTSAMQVRQPIGRMGVGAAETYREFLAPFVAAYAG